MSRKPTIAFTHLGCEKNRIDTEHIIGLLAQAGYEVDACLLYTSPSPRD